MIKVNNLEIVDEIADCNSRKRKLTFIEGASMSRIHISDLNPSDELLCLTDEQMLDINGGSWFTRILGGVLIVAGALTSSVGIGAALIAGGVDIIISGEQ